MVNFARKDRISAAKFISLRVGRLSLCEVSIHKISFVKLTLRPAMSKDSSCIKFMRGRDVTGKIKVQHCESS